MQLSKRENEGDACSIGQQLREENIRYTNIVLQTPNAILLQFRDQDNADKA